MCSSWHVSTLNKENSAFCPKNSGRVIQTALYVSIGTLRRKTLFWKKLEVFLKISEIEWNFVSNLAEKTSLWLSKLNSTCPWNISEQNNFFLKNYSLQNMFVYREKNTNCSETISAGLPKPLCMFQLKLSEEKHFSEKYFRFYYPFGLWVRNFWPNTKKISMRLSKPHFTCLWDQCRGRNFLIEILSFYDSRISI